MSDTTPEPAGNAATPGQAARYVRRPVVEALRWDGTAQGATVVIDWILTKDGTARYHDETPAIVVDVLGGTMTAVPGDWIVFEDDQMFNTLPDRPFHMAFEQLDAAQDAQPAPELAAAMDARDEYRDNAILHIRERDEARKRLGEAAGLHLIAAAERDKLRGQFEELRTELLASAEQTRPSKKSEIELSVARTIARILDGQ